MINSENVRFVEMTMDDFVELPGRAKVAAEGFLNHEACPTRTAIQAGLTDAVDDGRE